MSVQHIARGWASTDLISIRQAAEHFPALRGIRPIVLLVCRRRKERSVPAGTTERATGFVAAKNAAACVGAEFQRTYPAVRKADDAPYRATIHAGFPGRPRVRRRSSCPESVEPAAHIHSERRDRSARDPGHWLNQGATLHPSGCALLPILRVRGPERTTSRPERLRN